MWSYQTGSSILGRYSGAEVPSHFTSNSNILQLEFQADHSMSGRGFNITYSSQYPALLLPDHVLTTHVVLFSLLLGERSR